MTPEAILNYLKTIGKTKLAIGASGGLLALAFLFFLLTRVSQPDMALLYGDLDLRDSGQISEKLQTMATPFEIRDGGKQVYVPSNEVLKVRMGLAEAGLPMGGAVGYEIFDRSEILGSTSFIQNINLLRAVEGELARTIRTIQGVAAARVHVVMPQRALFSKDHQKPTAAIVLKMRGGVSRLGANQIQSIQHLVASSVPELTPDHISILDDRGVLLASGSEKIGSNGPGSMADARTLYETRLARMIESLLEQSIGIGKVRAEITAELDMDRVTEQSEIFDPNGQVARSTQTHSDMQRGAETGSTSGPSGVQSNIPNFSTPGGTGTSQNNESQKSEETTNYEISKTIKTSVREMGGVKRLSVAVLVDGLYEKTPNGQEVYKARTSKELEELTQLVRAVVGFQAQRGDVVDVMNLRFAKSPELIAEKESLWNTLGLQKKDWVRIIESLIVASVILLIFLFTVRPLLTSRAERIAASGLEGQSLDARKMDPSFGELAEGTLQPSIEGAGSQTSTSLPLLAREDKLNQIEELIQKYPDSAAMLLKRWLKK